MRLSICFVFLELLLLSTLISCASSSNSKQENRTTSNGEEKSNTLPLPIIPKDIQDPQLRTEYALNHFWDGLDMGDHLQVLDTAFMEQSFSNFIAILPYASEEVRKKVVEKLITRCKADIDVLKLVSWIANKYLDDPNSPMRSEELYMPFLVCLAEGDPAIPEDICDRASFRLSKAMKNRPGSIVPNFKVVLRDGTASDLHSLLATGENLLMFYDSDCEHCKEISRQLAATQFDANIKIIAIDVAGDRNLWDKRKSSLPSNWIVAFDLDNIEEKDLFYLPAFPTFYLLDSSGTIILKDPQL